MQMKSVVPDGSDDLVGNKIKTRESTSNDSANESMPLFCWYLINTLLTFIARLLSVANFTVTQANTPVLAALQVPARNDVKATKKEASSGDIFRFRITVRNGKFLFSLLDSN